MLSVNKFFENVSYKEIVASLAEVMAENFEDFAADQVRFNETISWFKTELEKGTSPSVTEVVDAINQRVGSMVLFSYFLGKLGSFYRPHWPDIFRCGCRNVPAGG